MGARENLQRLIDKKQQELQALETQMRETAVYIQALQDSMKFLGKEAGATEHILRPGTDLAKARDVIKKLGGPMHIDDLLKALGKPQDKQSRLSLNGTLSSYARIGRIFVKTASHTFSLIEFGPVPSNAEKEEFDLKEAGDER